MRVCSDAWQNIVSAKGGRSTLSSRAYRRHAAAARPEYLTRDARQLFERNILDSLGWAIAPCQVRVSKRCLKTFKRANDEVAREVAQTREAAAETRTERRRA